MARRRGKKVKQRIREDKFRDGIISITKKINENKFFVITLVVVIILFSLGFYLRRQRRARRDEEIAEIVTNPDRISLEDLRNALDRYSDEKFAPWLWLAYGRRLFSEYRNDAIMKKSDKEKLLEAERAFKRVVERFKESGTPFYSAKKMLSLVEKEKRFNLPWEKREETSAERTKALNWQKIQQQPHKTFLGRM